jgi:hypothetical protein
MPRSRMAANNVSRRRRLTCRKLRLAVEQWDAEPYVELARRLQTPHEATIVAHGRPT